MVLGTKLDILEDQLGSLYKHRPDSCLLMRDEEKKNIDMLSEEKKSFDNSLL